MCVRASASWHTRDTYTDIGGSSTKVRSSPTKVLNTPNVSVYSKLWLVNSVELPPMKMIPSRTSFFQIYWHSTLGEEEGETAPVSAPVLEAVCCIGQWGSSTSEISSSHVDNKVSIWHSSPVLSICWAVGGACSFTRLAGLKRSSMSLQSTLVTFQWKVLQVYTFRWCSGIVYGAKAQ